MSNVAGRPPILSIQGIVKLLREAFPFKHIEVGSVKSLPSYDDRNYYFRGILEHPQLTTKEAVACNGYTSSAGCSPKLEPYVLKINNPLCASFEVIKGLNFIMRHFQNQEFTCIQHALLSRNGNDALVLEGNSDDLMKYNSTVTTEKLVNRSSKVTEISKYIARVVTFIPGQLFDEIEKKYITPKLMFDVGNCFGMIAEKMQELSVPVVEARHLQWNLMKFLDVQQYMDCLDDPKEREIVEKVISDFKEHVVPKIPTFKKGIIHGDANGLNIVVKKSDASDEYELAGIIDFGDCVHSCYIFELGILLAYTMLENIEPVSGGSPIEFVVPLLRGFVQAFSFSQEEISSLYYVAMARCCQSAVLGTLSFKKEPWNTYLLTTPRKSWKLLQLMLDTSKEEVEQKWTEAAMTQKCSSHH